MMTVNEASRLSGVSVRTLHYYDKIGLLRPSGYTEAGYRLYDDTAMERLQQILLFRELEFSLREIGAILADPNFDRDKALEQQIALLTLKKEHLDNLITFARGIKRMEVRTMDFSAFDTKKMDEYAARAKAQWGNTPAYKEFSKKSKGRSRETEAAIGRGMMTIFEDFGAIREMPPDCAAARALVKRLQSYITEHYYVCTPEILASLGTLYGAGGDFTQNIDAAGGEGTARFASDAIAACVRSAPGPDADPA